jgi:N-acetylgalactosamine PTS system EIIA component
VNSVLDENTAPQNADVARAVVAGHGDFAAGIVSAVQQIAGMGSVFSVVSSIGLSGPDIELSLARALDASGADVLFTDLPAGSCTMAARRLQRTRPGLVLVTGVNLGTALEFAFRPAGESGIDAANASVEKGRATLSVHR